MGQGSPDGYARSTYRNDLPDVEVRFVGEDTTSLVFYAPVLDTEVRCLLDTGAEINLMSFEAWEKIPEEKRPSLLPLEVILKTVRGDYIPALGHGIFPLDMGRQEVAVDIIVCDIMDDVILGMPFFNEQGARIDVGRRQLYCEATGETTQCYTARQKPLLASVRLAKTVWVGPGEEYVVPGRVHYRGMIRRLAFVQGSPRFSRQHQVLVARSLVDTGKIRGQIGRAHV